MQNVESFAILTVLLSHTFLWFHFLFHKNYCFLQTLTATGGGSIIDVNLGGYKINNLFLYKVNLVEDPSATQPAFTCSKLKIDTLEQGAKYVQS